MKFETSFMHNNNEHFIMFCVPYILKSFRNGLFSLNNYYQHPRLELSTGYVLEAGVCTVSWVRKLHHENKDKLFSTYRMPRNVAYVDSLSKQKVSPALALFSTNLTSTLEKEYGNVAESIHKLLRIMNDYVVQPLFTISSQKGFKIKELIVFYLLITLD